MATVKPQYIGRCVASEHSSSSPSPSPYAFRFKHLLSIHRHLQDSCKFCCSRFRGERSNVELYFMFERAIIHSGAIELLGESFSSSRKKNKPLSTRLSCMHCKPYQEQPNFHCCHWQPSLIAQGQFF
ncbi:hypothetical protein VNO77_35557 [Canavalia gladiata]|uniref:Uncharacterized protein n=1 Tax=Canavalia gladiata TaxID=3824 RepID=A0AAN9PZ25_CANGL